jgi:hypothetical protein
VLLYAVGLAELVRELRAECETACVHVDASLVGQKVNLVGGESDGTPTVEASLVHAPTYAHARAATKDAVVASQLTCTVQVIGSSTRSEVPWEAVSINSRLTFGATSTTRVPRRISTSVGPSAT